MSIPGGKALFLTLSVESSAGLVGVTSGLLTARASLKRARAPSTLCLTPCKPSVSTDRETDEIDSAAGSPSALGVRSFHNAPTFLTKASGVFAESWVRRNPEGGA